jgi:hypothetical protein
LQITSVCPKCGKTGIQNINYKPNKANPKRAYLRFYHGRKKCYIGRVRTTDEVMTEFNKPETVEEYKETITNMVKEIQRLIKVYSTYSRKTKIPVGTLSSKLKEILSKHGY